jgi:hypothetical protein
MAWAKFRKREKFYVVLDKILNEQYHIGLWVFRHVVKHVNAASKSFGVTLICFYAFEYCFYHCCLVGLRAA